MTRGSSQEGSQLKRIIKAGLNLGEVRCDDGRSQNVCLLLFFLPSVSEMPWALNNNNVASNIDDEAVRIAVGLCLGLDLCVQHLCRCGLPVDARGLHSLASKQTPCRSPGITY